MQVCTAQWCGRGAVLSRYEAAADHVVAMGCQRLCGLGPIVAVTEDDETTVFRWVDLRRANALCRWLRGEDDRPDPMPW